MRLHNERQTAGIGDSKHTYSYIYYKTRSPYIKDGAEELHISERIFVLRSGFQVKVKLRKNKNKQQQPKKHKCISNPHEKPDKLALAVKSYCLPLQKLALKFKIFQAEGV